MSKEIDLHLNKRIYLKLLKSCYEEITYLFGDLTDMQVQEEHFHRWEFVESLSNEIIRISTILEEEVDKRTGYTHKDPWTALKSGDRPKDQEDVIVCNRQSKDDVVCDKAFYDEDQDAFLPYDTPDPLHKLNPTHYMRYKP